MVQEDNIVEDKEDKEEVEVNNTPNRPRRTFYVFTLAIFCAVSMMYLAVSGIDTKVSRIVAEGLVDILLFVSMLYIAAHTIDRMEILNMVLGRRNKNNGYSDYGSNDYSRGSDYVNTPVESQPQPQTKNKDGTYG